MELTSQDRKHIHARHRLKPQQDGHGVTTDLDTDRLFDRDCVGLVWGFLKHRSETKEFAMPRLVHQYLLMVLIHRRYVNLPGHHDISIPPRLAELIDALSRSKLFELNLRGQNSNLIIVK